MSTGLQIVQKFFPYVKKVNDATEGITLDVTKADGNSAAVKNHKSCALAVACKRKEKADGVIVSVSKAYVIKGTTATRYCLNESASREVISFDRNGGFDPGEYSLRAPEPSNRLGNIRGSDSNGSGKKKKIHRAHRTTGIRTALGSKFAA